MLEYLLNIYSFGAWCKYGRYSQHYMLDFPIFYSTISEWNFFTIMLVLIVIFFRILLFISAGIKANNLCYIFLLLTTYWFTLTTYKRARLTIFMLADNLFITCSLNWLKLEVISNIQCYVFIWITLLHRTFCEILPTYILASLLHYL